MKQLTTLKKQRGVIDPLIGGAVIGGLFSAFGGASANRARRREAARNRAFQERMSSTAYQRQTKDLELAGLNRILGYTKAGPASTPGGAMAQQQDILTPAVSTALQARRLGAEIANIKANQKLTEAKTNVIKPATAAGKQIGSWIETITSADWQNMNETTARQISKALKASKENKQKKFQRGVKAFDRKQKAQRKKPMTIVIKKGRND